MYMMETRNVRSSTRCFPVLKRNKIINENILFSLPAYYVCEYAFYHYHARARRGRFRAVVSGTISGCGLFVFLCVLRYYRTRKSHVRHLIVSGGGHTHDTNDPTADTYRLRREKRVCEATRSSRRMAVE